VKRIDGGAGSISYSVQQIFENQGRTSADVLNLVHEVDGKSQSIKKRLRIAKSGLRTFFATGLPTLVFFALFVALTPVFYLYRVQTAKREITPTSITQQVRQDAETIKTRLGAENESVLRRIGAAAKELSDIVSAIPNIILLVALVFGGVRWLLSRPPNWRISQLASVDKPLREFAQALREKVQPHPQGNMLMIETIFRAIEVASQIPGAMETLTRLGVFPANLLKAQDKNPERGSALAPLIEGQKEELSKLVQEFNGINQIPDYDKVEKDRFRKRVAAQAYTLLKQSKGLSSKIPDYAAITEFFAEVSDSKTTA
jgi:hypothetical protein